MKCSRTSQRAALASCTSTECTCATLSAVRRNILDTLHAVSFKICIHATRSARDGAACKPTNMTLRGHRTEFSGTWPPKANRGMRTATSHQFATNASRELRGGEQLVLHEIGVDGHGERERVRARRGWGLAQFGAFWAKTGQRECAAPRAKVGAGVMSLNVCRLLSVERQKPHQGSATRAASVHPRKSH